MSPEQYQYRQFVIGDALRKLREGEVIELLGSIQSDLANAGEVSLSLDAIEIARYFMEFTRKLEAKLSE